MACSVMVAADEMPIRTAARFGLLIQSRLVNDSKMAIKHTYHIVVMSRAI